MDSAVNDLKLFQKISIDEEEEIGLEETDDGDEEEQVEECVTLGIVEKPTNPNFLLRHFFPSKAGGVPAWLEPLNLPSSKSCKCDFCEEPLQFLLQIKAPIYEKESTFHRMLYVFMCPSMACLRQDQHEQWKRREDNPRRSLKVFRCQLPQSNPFYSSEPPKRDGSDKPMGVGAALCSWCGTWKGDKVCSSCKQARYCSKKHQSMHWKSGHKNQCRQAINNAGSASSGSSITWFPVCGKVANSSLWPEYEIFIEDDCASDSDASDSDAYDSDDSEDNSYANSLVPQHMRGDDDTYQFLSDKFEADDNIKIRASFQERIFKYPNQVLRHCRDLTASPLWPSSIGRPSVVNIPKCNYCNGPLCYEFQIMPQLLYYFGVRHDRDSLDWETIVVYTCLASCESSTIYKEEFTWVQL